MGELSHIQSLAAEISKQMPSLAKSCNKRHYHHHINFLETVCKQLPNLAKGLGKRYFKMHLELFLESIFYSLVSFLKLYVFEIYIEDLKTISMIKRHRVLYLFADYCTTKNLKIQNVSIDRS